MGKVKEWNSMFFMNKFQKILIIVAGVMLIVFGLFAVQYLDGLGNSDVALGMRLWAGPIILLTSKTSKHISVITTRLFQLVHFS